MGQWCKKMLKMIYCMNHLFKLNEILFGIIVFIGRVLVIQKYVADIINE